LASDFISLISAYGPAFVGGVLALESLCIPVPGETVLLTAAVYAGKTHDISIWAVFVAGVAGAVCGNLLAFWLGRKYGYGLLWRYGSYLHLTPARLRLGQYLFLRHGGKFVILARFVPLLRSIAGALAGANCMPLGRFLVANLVGALAWVALDCSCAYSIGRALARVAPWVGIALVCIVLLLAAGAAMFLKRHEKRLELEAERALGGALGKRGSVG
jgi:membrane protein DedA with SNARE-associated domain